MPSLATTKTESKIDLSKFLGLAIPFSSIVVSLLILVLVAWPKLSQTLKLKNSNEELSVRASRLDEKIQSLASLDEDLLEEQVGIGEKLLPSEKNIFSFVSQIEKVAGASGVLINRIETTPGVIEEPISDLGSTAVSSGKTDGVVSATGVEVGITLSGGYNSVLSFLNNMLAVARVVNINNLTVTKTSTEGSLLRATMSISGYWKSLPKDLGTIESPINKLSESEVATLERVKETGLATIPVIPSVSLGKTNIFEPF